MRPIQIPEEWLNKKPSKIHRSPIYAEYGAAKKEITVPRQKKKYTQLSEHQLKLIRREINILLDKNINDASVIYYELKTKGVLTENDFTMPIGSLKYHIYICRKNKGIKYEVVRIYAKVNNLFAEGKTIKEVIAITGASQSYIRELYSARNGKAGHRNVNTGLI